MDGADPHRQRLLQLQEDVGANPGAGGGAVRGRGFVQQLLKTVQFNQQHHVLQEVTLDERRQLRGAQELDTREKV